MESQAAFIFSEDVLYSAMHKIFVTSKGKDYSRNLKLTVSQINVMEPVSQTNIGVKITDDEDLFVYYTLVLNESDFLTVREEQGLLVDYEKFPIQLINLFEDCKQESDISPKYYLVLDEVSPEPVGSRNLRLKVMETNKFKQLCHLCLDMHTGTEGEVKSHVSSEISKLKGLLRLAEARFLESEIQVDEVKRKLEEKEKEIADMQEQWRHETSIYRRQGKQELSAERDTFRKIQSELKTTFDSEKKAVQQMLVEEKKANEDLHSENKLLIDHNSNLKSKLREASQQLVIAKEDIFILNREKERLLAQSAKLGTGYHEKEKILNDVKTKLAVFEQEVRDKNELLIQQGNLLKVAQEQKGLLETSLAEKLEELRNKCASLATLSQELFKANEIVEKLSRESNELRAQLRRRTNIAIEQQIFISTRETEIGDLKVKITELKGKIEERDKQITKLEQTKFELKETIAAAESKVAEQETKLNRNANLISCLNRRCAKLRRPSGTETHKTASLTVGCTSTPHLTASMQSSETLSSTSKDVPTPQRSDETITSAVQSQVPSATRPMAEVAGAAGLATGFDQKLIISASSKGAIVKPKKIQGKQNPKMDPYEYFSRR